ncbi:ead/Ea22-like family protein [Salmonella enterica]|uniref:Ead/Ea22-like family protein n=1 Tax=Salmonella enterica TaxID=28901 RepID=A0A5T6HAZ3_SALER|nr:ead/Ea22-like family protein [Salmonella enterica]
MSNIDKQALREAAERAIHDDWGYDTDIFHEQVTPSVVLALLDENLQLQREKDAIEAVALAMRDDMRDAREQLEEAEKQVEEFTMWIKRLAHSLRNAKPNSKLYGAAMDYLSRKGLISVEDVLR